jgi:hypothetical protein
MKKLLIVLIAICFQACVVHVYQTKSKPDISKEAKYVFENDTIQIAYDLWYPRGSMHFSIYNKLNIPIFIDWKNSALIINGNTINYWKDRTSTEAVTSGSYGRGYYGGYSKGEMIHDDRLSVIPAHAHINKVSTKKFIDAKFPTQVDLHTHIRNYIAYSTYEDFHNENFADCDFEIIEIIKTTQHKYKRYKDARSFYIDN